MRRQYEISPGNQYDRFGARVQCGSLSTSYSLEDDRLVQLAGHMPCLEDLDAVDAAVRRVIPSREPETLILGEASPTIDCPEWVSSRGLTLTEEMDRDDSPY